MNFEYKIKYLDYLQAGMKVRGAGFVRLECWGSSFQLTIQVSGMVETPKGSFPVMLSGAGQKGKVGEICLCQGRGRVLFRELNCEKVSEELGIPVTALECLVIPLGEDRELAAIFREERKTRWQETAPEEENTEEEVRAEEEALTLTEPQGEGEAKAAEETLAVEEVRAMAEPHAAEEAQAGAETPAPDVKPAGGGEKEQAQVQRPYVTQAALRPGKWEQLKSIYPTIAPFGDSRRYLQISPGDFVILKDRSYRMVNNSFLLHGYFTYRHLILHRMERKGEATYYVGVPGSFYGKEKEVAILFGFESFEGAAEPTREGDFGYYMMRVEL
ncbi:MAG: hypothetical protein IKS85_08450 [Lachnospiraceae bacterium]|nr:hypothetical protein [Lachnospiraceae bacterium]